MRAIRWYSSCAAANLDAVGRVADDIAVLVSTCPSARFSASLTQTAGARDERIVAALTARLGDIPLRVVDARYEPQADEPLWFEVALYDTETTVAEWDVEVYVVDKRACLPSVPARPAPAPKDAHTRRLEGRVQKLALELREAAEASALAERRLQEALSANEELASTVKGLVELNVQILAKSKALAAENKRLRGSLVHPH
jgi:hypothetical protein